MENLQSIIAVIIVLVTAGIVLYRAFGKKKSGCGSGCGCAGETKKFPSAKKK
ncbi:MAG: FeoB-associated Cys-rich membrane protein [Candidatus Omnitrophica bacterium]|nr:FeoB-associated Cys-rich membrane protein [Candidatus Omnitrophota bacterium]